MNPVILHEIPGRIRVRYPVPPEARSRVTAAVMAMAAGKEWLSVRVSPRTGNVVITYSTLVDRDCVAIALVSVTIRDADDPPPAPPASPSIADAIVARVTRIAIRKGTGALLQALCPAPLKPVLAIIRALSTLVRTPGAVAALGVVDTVALAVAAVGLTLVGRNAGLGFAAFVIRRSTDSDRIVPVRPLWQWFALGVLHLLSPWAGATAASLLAADRPGQRHRRGSGVLLLPAPRQSGGASRIA